MGDTIHRRDRISKLPNVIIHRVMSYLTAKEKFRLSIGPLDVKGSSFLLEKWIGLAIENEVVEFFTSYDEVESIDIAAPCIQKISLRFSKREPSCAIDISKSPLLKYLDLKGANFLDEEFDSIVSKYPLLKNLFVSSVIFLKSLKDIDIDTPNLVSFYYEGNSVPKSSINAPCSWDVRFENEGALNTRFVYVKDFLGVNQIEDLFITLKSEKHYLKDVEIYCFQLDGDEEPYDIDDLNKELPELPLGDLYFRLDWWCDEA
ncbi:hypothetical protein EZV62_003919 [Acer yangbiense]|uniref:FBD domain-containing protein n=1 Tax=Acer yangbiense TaxID=1000413 RepID=A0A5C7IJA0_9ROSI|nr:hypothetical protein EZV62_003919 [Acer yangbiense]